MRRWGTAGPRLCILGMRKIAENPSFRNLGHLLLRRNPSRVFTSGSPDWPSNAPSVPKPEAREVRLNTLFWSRPCSLALAADSPLRIEEPQYEGIKRMVLKLMLFYSKQSKSIRGANVIFKRVVLQVDKPAIYDGIQCRIYVVVGGGGKEGVELGQYLYEIYNHDLELRVSKAGVNLLLTKWMKDLEKIFYGNIVAYDAAISTEAKNGDLINVIWRNIYADDGSPMPTDAAADAVKAFSRYARRESTCLSLTDKESIFSGNFIFTPLDKHLP